MNRQLGCPGFFGSSPGSTGCCRSRSRRPFPTCRLGVQKNPERRLATSMASSISYSYSRVLGMSGARRRLGLEPLLAMGAFVLSNARGIRPEDVCAFNAKSTDDREDRLRIQSLFYKVDVDNGAAAFSANNYYSAYFSQQSYAAYPGFQLLLLLPDRSAARTPLRRPRLARRLRLRRPPAKAA